VAVGTELHRNLKEALHDTGTRRLGVTLQYDRVKTVSPVPGAHLKQGLRTMGRLTIDGIVGERPGFEIGLSGQPIDWVGGLYLRAGYRVGEERGATYAAGVELGHGPTTSIASIVAQVGLAILLAYAASKVPRDDEEALRLAP
jgi:hypothetical protein